MKADTTRLDAPTVLIAAAAFLAPFLGSGVPLETLSLPPGGTLAAILGGAEVPLLSRAVLAMLVLAALAITMARRQVAQIPQGKVAATFLAFFGVLIASVAVSSFRTVSLLAAASWLTYGLVFFAAVACLGRTRGPKVVLTALFVAIALVAALGIREYGETRGRIFGGWNNPNALAGILGVGLFVGLAITATAERAAAMLSGIGVVLIGFAIVLTQSRGGTLAAMAGAAVFAALAVAWNQGNGFARWAPLARAAICIAFIFGASTLLQMRQQGAAGGAPASRLANVAQTQEQSVGFRLNLYRGALELVRHRPIGYGMGTYRFEGTRSGLTTATVLTHNSLLELAVEASPVAPALLLIAGGLWLAQMFRGARRLPAETGLLRAGTVAAVATAFLHAQIESGLHMYGIGFAFFLLLGIGMLLSSDAVAPEFVPKGARGLAVGLSALTVLLLTIGGTGESLRARARYEAQQGNAESARALLDRVPMPRDGETSYLRGLYARDAAERTNALTEATQLAPTPRNFRLLARHLLALGKPTEALVPLRAALGVDPNNLPALLLLMETQAQMENASGATETARRLVAVEKTPYFTIRAIPEVVPMQTYDAREYLAAATAEPTAKVELLRPAMDGYLAYARSTFPMAILDGETGVQRTDDTPDEARERLQRGIRLIRDLATAYRSTGDSAGAAEAEAAVAELETALAGGNK